MIKDEIIAKKLLNNLGLNPKGLNEVKKLMDSAQDAGLSDSDSSVIHTILEKTYK